MKFSAPLVWFTLALGILRADIRPAKYDMREVRDPSTLETKVIQDWTPLKADPTIRQKLVEITVCEWWPGQKVRLPLTFLAPVSGETCRNVLLGNMGLGNRPAMPDETELRLLKEHGVGVVLIGMGTLDMMAPVGKLHLAMKHQLLSTRNLRFTPGWIWGMSDMRALTAALAEGDVYRPNKVLAYGGSKRGLAAAAAGIHDDRFTAIMPIVAPPSGSPGGPFLVGFEMPAIRQVNAEFLAALDAGTAANPPKTTRAALEVHGVDQNGRFTVEEARSAGWDTREVLRVNHYAWDVALIGSHLPTVRKRGLAMYYVVGTNDNVTPALEEFGRHALDFPMWIVPGGQHGGPQNAGFTRRVPQMPEVAKARYLFAQFHFFNARQWISTPRISRQWDAAECRLRVTVKFPDNTEPETNELWWSANRNAPGTIPRHYDAWQSAPLKRTGQATYSGDIALATMPQNVEFLSVHTHTANDLPLTISSPLQLWGP